MPGSEPENLLKENALLGPEGLLEGGHPDDLLPGEVHRAGALPLEGDAHPVAGDEEIAFPLKGEGPILQREAQDGDDGVRRPGGEGDGSHERQRLGGGQAPEPLIEGWRRSSAG